ncbi:MAG: D-alanyl-D-alanine carboxypeptidase/D-alanyl-D-alanine-endopeptidase [Pseudomonadota bacterium]
MRFLIRLFIFIVFFGQAVAAQTVQDVVQQFLPSGSHSVALLDLKTGKIVASSNARKSLPPASVMKVPTTLYALKALGSDYRFQTRVLFSTTQLQDGVLKGDLILAGGGNPTLDTDGLARMAADLADLGLKRVEGDFLVYGGALPYQKFLDPDQLDYVGYNPSISGLNLNFNRVFFEWKASGGSYTLGMSAKTRAYKPPIRGIKMGIANRKTPLYKHSSANGIEKWTVAGQALGGGGNRWLPVRDPDAYAGEVFRYFAAQKGIQLGPAKTLKSAPKGTVVAIDHSASLVKQLRAMLRFSTNLSAETIGMRASQKRGKKIGGTRDSARAMEGWFGQTGAKFFDHSGLNVKSRLTAEAMVRFLAESDAQRHVRPLLKEVELRNLEWKKSPVSGAKIVAKTGTLNFTSALAGYIQTPSGGSYAFAIFTHDAKKHGAIPKAQRDRAPGAKTWARESRILQHQLLRVWAGR